LTEEEIAKFEKWIVANVDESVVPADEGFAEGLVYNLVHLLRGDNNRFDYKKEQYEEMALWGLISPDALIYYTDWNLWKGGS
jgi:hypothetical protein